MKGFFITGTDTEVGKTYATTLLLKAFVQSGVQAYGYKPIVCGDRQDVVLLAEASASPLPLDLINPLWLKMPAAPLVAAQFQNLNIEWQSLLNGAQHFASQHGELLLVEGAGGWRVPITPTQSMAELAVDLNLPVLLVIDNKLGAINHTLLTLESIAASGLTCAGLIINHPREERDAASISNISAITSQTNVPILLEIMHGQTEINELPTELKR